MFDGEMCREVICQVVGVTVRVGSTHRTDDLLKDRGLSMLLGHMISQLCLRESNLPTYGASEGLW